MRLNDLSPELIGEGRTKYDSIRNTGVNDLIWIINGCDIVRA